MEGIIFYSDSLSDVTRPQKQEHIPILQPSNQVFTAHTQCWWWSLLLSYVLASITRLLFGILPIRWVNIWNAANTHHRQHHRHQVQTSVWFYATKHFISSVPELMTSGFHFSSSEFSPLIHQASSGLNISFSWLIWHHFVIMHNYN